MTVSPSPPNVIIVPTIFTNFVPVCWNTVASLAVRVQVMSHMRWCLHEWHETPKTTLLVLKWHTTPVQLKWNKGTPQLANHRSVFSAASGPPSSAIARTQHGHQAVVYLHLTLGNQLGAAGACGPPVINHVTCLSHRCCQRS